MLIHPDFDPVAVSLGPLQVRWYGLMYLAGFSLAWVLGRYRAKQPGSGWSPVLVDDLITWTILGLVLGARLGYVLFYDFPHLLEDPLTLIKIWQGGMSFHGGAVGVGIVFWLFGRKHGMGFWGVADFIVPLAPPGLFCGRLGNFINGELWGAPTNLPWGVVFPDPRAGNVARHPSQLYEAGLEGIVLFAILWLYSAKPRPRGAVSALFLFFYGVFRFSVEFVRLPDPQLGYLAFGWLTMGQILSLPMIVIGLAVFAASYSRPKSIISNSPQ